MPERPARSQSSPAPLAALRRAALRNMPHSRLALARLRKYRPIWFAPKAYVASSSGLEIEYRDVLRTASKTSSL